MGVCYEGATMLHLPSFFWEEFSYVARLKKNTLRKQDRRNGGKWGPEIYSILDIVHEGGRAGGGATVEVTGRKENRTPS